MFIRGETWLLQQDGKINSVLAGGKQPRSNRRVCSQGGKRSSLQRLNNFTALYLEEGASSLRPSSSLYPALISLHVSFGSCSFSSTHFCPFHRPLQLLPLCVPQSQTCLPHHNPSLPPTTLNHAPSPIFLPFTQKPGLIPTPLMSSHLLVTLSCPAQQLPSLSHQSRLEYSAFRSFPLQPSAENQHHGAGNSQNLHRSHSWDYKRCVKIPAKCEPAECHCWETLKLTDHVALGPSPPGCQLLALTP